MTPQSKKLNPAIFGVKGPRLTFWEKAFFAQTQPFGFILFARNIETVDQVRGLCADLRTAVGWNAPILMDQEGGRVQRLLPPMATQFPPPLEQAELAGMQAADVFFARYAIIGDELRKVGIDVNCAPNLDIARDHTHPFLQNRCYGRTRDQVSTRGRAAYDGLLASGVMPVIKHMPGHGLATADSHKGLSRVTEDYDYLIENDFAVFADFADAKMGMSAHILFDAIDPLWPATVSARMVEIMRNELSFSGLIMTDDVSMEALPGTILTRAASAQRAGIDVVLHCNGDADEMQSVVEFLEPPSALTYRRMQAVLDERDALVPQSLDIDALRAQLGV